MAHSESKERERDHRTLDDQLSQRRSSFRSHGGASTIDLRRFRVD